MESQIRGASGYLNAATTNMQNVYCPFQAHSPADASDLHSLEDVHVQELDLVTHMTEHASSGSKLYCWIPGAGGSNELKTFAEGHHAVRISRGKVTSSYSKFHQLKISNTIHTPLI